MAAGGPDRGDAAGGSRRSADRVGQMLLLIALTLLAISGLGISSAAAASPDRGGRQLPSSNCSPASGQGDARARGRGDCEVAIAIGLAIGAAAPR
jgi:hypothetical protein